MVQNFEVICNRLNMDRIGTKVLQPKIILVSTVGDIFTLVGNKKFGSCRIRSNEARRHAAEVVTFALLRASPSVYLSCCSFFTSLSRAWKSIDRRATIELTSSIPDNKVNISFLPSAHSLVLSRGDMRLIRTRHGRIGRISLGVHFDNSEMSTF